MNHIHITLWLMCISNVPVCCLSLCVCCLCCRLLIEDMYHHAWTSYVKHAFPADELQPVA